MQPFHWDVRRTQHTLSPRWGGGKTQGKMTGIELIAQERQEQREKHGRTIAHDVLFNRQSQLVEAASTLIQVSDGCQYFAPAGWDVGIFKKMMSKAYKERLVIAGALLAAEIDRIQSLYDTLSGDGDGMGDPSDQARDSEQLDHEIASFEATT